MQQTNIGDREGHPISIVEVDVDGLAAQAGAIEAIYDAKRTGVVVRGAFSPALMEAAASQLTSGGLDDEWSSPNAGMTGGEIRVVGDAATPTFTALTGPTLETYANSAARHEDRTRLVFGTDARPTQHLQSLLSRLFGGRPAAPATHVDDTSWSPYNFRALDPGQQIYTHHDDHYRLSIYDSMDPGLDRSTVLSFFVTLQHPDSGGQLVVYSLWGSDPNPPMLPTRFLDTEAIERRFDQQVLALRAGDLLVFDAGRHVHRVTPIEGSRPRMTFGGFMTLDSERTRLAFWA
jgi:hapalindole-type alkaloid chlorinase